MSHKDWFMFMESLIVQALTKFPKSSRMHLLYSYILKEELNNKFLALQELILAEQCSQDSRQKFSIFRMKSFIEEEIILDDQVFCEKKGVNVNLMINF